MRLSLSRAGSPIGWEEWSNLGNDSHPVMKMTAETGGSPNLERTVGDIKVCVVGKSGILAQDFHYCNARVDCPGGADEAGCPWYVNYRTPTSIAICIGVVISGLVVFLLIKCCLGDHEETNDGIELGEAPIGVNSIDRIVCSFTRMEDTAQLLEELEQEYGNIHATEGGLKELITCTFTLLEDRKQKHQASKVFHSMEMKLHGEKRLEVLNCVRAKAGSNKETEAFLDNLKVPGQLRKSKQQASQTMRKVRHILPRCLQLGVLPTMKVGLFLFDTLKDIALWLYLGHSSKYLGESEGELFLKGLITVHGATIFLSQTIMGIFALTSHLLPIKSNWIRLLCLPFAPLIPCLIVMETIHLQNQTEHLIDDWRRNGGSPTGTMTQIAVLSRKRDDLLKFYSQMRMIECSLEALPQFLLQLIYLLVENKISTDHSQQLDNLGGDGVFETTDLDLEVFNLLPAADSLAIGILIGNTVFSYCTAISALLNATNIRKNRGMTLMQRLFVGLSYACQIVARGLLIVIPAVCCIIGKLQSGTTWMLLSLPFAAHWVTLAAASFIVSPPFTGLAFKDQLLHVISNSFVVMPVRSLDSTARRQKLREIVVALILTLLNICVTTLAAYGSLVELDDSWEKQRHDTATTIVTHPLLLIFGPTILHLMGCILLLDSYQLFHPWRDIFWTQRQKATRGKKEAAKVCKKTISPHSSRHLVLLNPRSLNITLPYIFFSKHTEPKSEVYSRNLMDNNYKYQILIWYLIRLLTLERVCKDRRSQ